MQYKHSLLYSSLMLAFSGSLYAETSEYTETDSFNNNEVTLLDEVIVSGTPFSQQIGTQTITEKQIARQAAKNGGITDLLKSNPNVRFSSQADLSTNAGEIAPNEVSFHGEKYYNNNFVLDGMSNNDNLNPSGNINRYGDLNGATPYSLPNGNSQSMWINVGLLKSVEAFDSNISAKYGEFTGGVIDAKLKDPDFERQRSGKIYYRTTRDTWTHFYIQEGQKEQFQKANRMDYHPKFVKHTYGINLHERLSDKFSLMFNYEKTTSDIDSYHNALYYRNNPSEPVQNNQKRVNETILMRGVYLPDNGDLWRATVLYSPHKSQLFRQNAVNGNYDSVGGGLQTNIEWEKLLFDSLKMTSYLGYKRTGDTIEYDQLHYHNYAITDSIDWVSGSYATYGGYGKYYTQKETYTAKQDFSLNSFDFANIEHKLAFGWIAELGRAKYQRDDETTLNTYQVGNVICNGDPACIDGEQFAYSRSVYAPRNIKVSDQNFALYLEDRMKYKRLELNIGARLNYNSFLKNYNLAHRISGSYDLFGNGNTQLFGGLNRYYGNSLLAFQLRQGIGYNETQRRSLNADRTLGEWGDNRSGNVATRYLNTKVKTPYADEQVLGLSQKMFGTRWTAKWVHRDSKDQFSSSNRYVDGTLYRVLNNNGSSRNDTFTLSIAPLQEYAFKYAIIGWDMGFRISRSKSNNNYYDQTADFGTKVIYNGRLIDSADLPPNDFNTPWSAHFNLNTEFPKLNLSWDQRFSFTKGKKTREMTGGSVICTGVANSSGCDDSYVGEASIYQDAEYGSMFNVDWRFTYKQPTFKDQVLEITLDVNNVLNKKSLSKGSSSRAVYKQGRNFWLGASYSW